MRKMNVKLVVAIDFVLPPPAGPSVFPVSRTADGNRVHDEVD